MAAAKQAYFEWMPVRPSIAGTTYRRLRFGTLADLHLLDLRSFRDEQAKPGSGAVDDPGRTLTGRAQLDWLKAGLERSDTAWRLVGTSVMISQVAFGAAPRASARPARRDPRDTQGGPGGQHRPVGRLHRRPARAARPPQRPRHRQHRLPDRRHPHGLGQRGAAPGGDLPRRPAPVATEFVVTSVTSDNVDDFLHVAPHTVSLAGVAALKAANRHVKWLDMDSHGYGVLDVTRRAHADGLFRHLRQDRPERHQRHCCARTAPGPAPSSWSGRTGRVG